MGMSMTAFDKLSAIQKRLWMIEHKFTIFSYCLNPETGEVHVHKVYREDPPRSYGSNRQAVMCGTRPSGFIHAEDESVAKGRVQVGAFCMECLAQARGETFLVAHNATGMDRSLYVRSRELYNHGLR